MGTPKKLPIFFISQKMGNRKKKKMCTKWEFSKKIKMDPQKKIILEEKYPNQFYRGKMWFHNFSTEWMSQKTKKMGKKWALDQTRPFSKNGRSQKKIKMVKCPFFSIFFQKKNSAHLPHQPSSASLFGCHPPAEIS